MKVWNRDEINEILNTSDAAVERAIIRLFELQNEDEQRHASTNVHNNRGFSSSDARAGTRFARWLQGMDNKNVVRYAKKSLNHPRAAGIFGRYCQDGGTVMDRARKIALKHSRQLVDIANAKAENNAKNEEPAPVAVSKPIDAPVGSWAQTARMMAQMDNSGFDWDAWKDEMKERHV